MPFDRTTPYGIGSDKLPGLSKVVEELGEVGQVLGKIMGLGSMGLHWDGTVLHDELLKEFADLSAAMQFFMEKNQLPNLVVGERAKRKLRRFHQWHDNIQAGLDPNDGVDYERHERVPTRI